MKIPYYRRSSYEDDGVDIYQCLHCGGGTGVRTWKWDIKYCPYCGVIYKGFVLEQKYFYMSYYFSKILWRIEVSEWDIFDKKYGEWKEEHTLKHHKENYTAHDVIKELNHYRDLSLGEIKAEKKRGKLFEKNSGQKPCYLKDKPDRYRAIRIKDKEGRSQVKIKVKKVFEKTGKFIYNTKTDYSHGQCKEIRPIELFGEVV